MLPDGLIFVPATLDETGELTATPGGSSTAVDCYIEERTQLAPDPGGKQVISTIQVFVDVYSLTVDAHLYTLPSRFPVNLKQEAVAIDHATDEFGAYAETVMF